MRTKTINLRRGAFGQPSVPFLLSRRAHLLTTRKAGGGYPSRWSGRALFTKRLSALLQRGQAMPQAGIACAAGFMFCTISKKQCGRHIATPIPPPACENLPPAVLSQLWVSLLRHPFSFCEKEIKTGTPCFGAYQRKDAENGWRSITWKRRWSAEVRGALQLPLPLI